MKNQLQALVLELLNESILNSHFNNNRLPCQPRRCIPIPQMCHCGIKFRGWEEGKYQIAFPRLCPCQCDLKKP